VFAKRKILIGAAVAAAAAVDAVMAYHIYVLKKGTVVKDMAIKALEEKLRGEVGEGGEAKEIIIEPGGEE
jgi:hypothetical protein